MNEAAVQVRVEELRAMLTKSRLLQGEKEPDSDGVYVAQTAGGREGLEEELEQLRLHLKYLLFDLEATRRENRYLRQMIESRTRRNPEKNDDSSDWKPPSGF